MMKIFVLSVLTLATLTAAPADVLKSFSLTNNQFSADIYREYRATAEKNFVVCPLSVEVLLALIHAGASGNTAEQLSTALRLPKSRQSIDEIFRELHPKLQVDDKYTLQSANKIYVKNGFSVRDQYKSTAVDVFGASIQNIDFKQKAAAVSEINSWVDENTRHKINQLVTERDINENTRAVLLNAIYFKGKWTKEFKKDDTKERPFYLTKKTYVDADLMEQTAYFRYAHSPSLKARFVELPYEGDAVTMTIVLPDDEEGLPALEEKIQDVVIEPNYSFQLVNLRIPKNKITSDIKFNPILEKLGITEAFTDSADFQNMLNIKDEPLFISKVIQKALIETDEEGTVAVAVSGGFMVTTLSLPRPPPIPIKFYANHPFIFFLKHKDTGIFFIGRYSQPAGNVKTVEN